LVFPTFITDLDTEYRHAINAVQSVKNSNTGAVGLHLEGPFLSRGRPGIHNVEKIRKLNKRDLNLICSASIPVLLTLAPEETDLKNIAELTKRGVIVFAGHSEANYSTVKEASYRGLTGVTHLFNAMSQMQNREPGIVGAAFDDLKLFAGIIADGIHVHEANVRTALKQIGASRLFLVTDAMSPLGTAGNRFELVGKQIYRGDGKLTNADGILAGADISMIQSVKRFMEFTDCGLHKAIQVATLTPAKAAGLDDEIGSISVGKRAGFTLLNNDLTVQGVARFNKGL